MTNKKSDPENQSIFDETERKSKAKMSKGSVGPNERSKAKLRKRGKEKKRARTKDWPSCAFLFLLSFMILKWVIGPVQFVLETWANGDGGGGGDLLVVPDFVFQKNRLRFARNLMDWPDKCGCRAGRMMRLQWTKEEERRKERHNAVMRRRTDINVNRKRSV